MIHMNSDLYDNNQIDMRQVLDLMRNEIESRIDNQINKSVYNKIKNGLFPEPENNFSKCDSLSVASTHESVDFMESKFHSDSVQELLAR